MPPHVSFVIADDHPGVVSAVRHLISDVETFEVTGEAGNADELLSILDHVSCNVVITDYSMPGNRYGDGIILFECIQQRHPDLRIVVLTMLETRALLSNILNTGIKVIVSKCDGPRHILEGVHAALEDRIYLSPHLDAQLARAAMAPQPVENDAIHQLGKRELEVLRLYASGLTVSEIALRLNRSVKTISAQKQTSMRKLSLDTEAALFDFAVHHGLLDNADG